MSEEVEELESTEVQTALKDERNEIRGLIKQLQGLHSENKSIITTLDFLNDLILRRDEPNRED